MNHQIRVMDTLYFSRSQESSLSDHTMGSLPLSHLDFPSVNGHSHHQDISKDNLLTLFKSQQDLLSHFFKHLDLSQTLSFSCLLLSTSGTVFFTGVGKSTFVVNKVSQTLSFRSSILSPLNALHGDLPLERELCPFNLTSVTSTAIQMVFGDTIAFSLMAARNLTKEEYGANHPAGCFLQVKDVMKKKDELPVCKEGDMIMDQLVELTSKGCWCLLVVDEGHRLIGTFTDGDLRRTLKATPSYPETHIFA